MSTQELIDTARARVAGDQGLVAIDVSDPICNQRFARLTMLRRTAHTRRGGTS